MILRRAARSFDNSSLATQAELSMTKYGNLTDGYFSFHLNLTDYLALLYPPFGWQAPPAQPAAASRFETKRERWHDAIAPRAAAAAAATAVAAPIVSSCADRNCILTAFNQTREAGSGASLTLTITKNLSASAGLGLLNSGSCKAEFCAQSVTVIGSSTSTVTNDADGGAGLPAAATLNATWVVRGVGGSNLTLSRLVITAQAYYASALYVTNGGHATVLRCRFLSNSNLQWWDPVNKWFGSYKTSPDWAGGGAITVQSTARGLVVQHCEFTANKGVVAGAIRVGAMMGDVKGVFLTTALHISNSSFHGNTGLASKEGVDVAIYWDGQKTWTNEAANTAGTTARGCIWPQC